MKPNSWQSLGRPGRPNDNLVLKCKTINQRSPARTQDLIHGTVYDSRLAHEAPTLAGNLATKCENNRLRGFNEPLATGIPEHDGIKERPATYDNGCPDGGKRHEEAGEQDANQGKGGGGCVQSRSR
jgi:hypothetical protein